MKKSNVIVSIIILAIIVFTIYVRTRPPTQTDEELTACIANNSILYVKDGCYACGIQEDMFGTNYALLNKFTCDSDWENCRAIGITATPTWKIKGKLYKGVQSIAKLKQLTGC